MDDPAGVLEPARRSPADVVHGAVAARRARRARRKPDTLHYSAQVYEYFRALAASSPRVKLITIGQTEEGKDIVVAFVSSEDNIRNLESLRDDLVHLGDPRRVDDAEAGRIIGRAKPLYHIVGGLHAQETGPSEMLMSWRTGWRSRTAGRFDPSATR